VKPTPATSPADRVWTTRQLLVWIKSALEKAKMDSPRLCAELLVARVIGCDRLRLYVESDRPATGAERDRLRGLVRRALAHEPVQYLVEEAWFFSLPFHVDRRTLIPRPETETIVQAVLQHARATPAMGKGVIADIGTGSGCVIVALLKNLPEAHGVGIDLCPDALESARENAQRHDVLDRLDLLQGDLLAPVMDHPAGRSVNYLVSNPPYIPDHEWAAVGENVRKEPLVALRGGVDGLQCIRPILENASRVLTPGGMLAIEFAESTADEVLSIAQRQAELDNLRIETDFQGKPRVLVGHRRP